LELVECQDTYKALTILFKINDSEDEMRAEMIAFCDYFVEFPCGETILKGAYEIRAEQGTGRFPRFRDIRERALAVIRAKKMPEIHNGEELDGKTPVNLYMVVFARRCNWNKVVPGTFRACLRMGSEKRFYNTYEIEYKAKNKFDAMRYIGSKLESNIPSKLGEWKGVGDIDMNWNRGKEKELLLKGGE